MNKNTVQRVFQLKGWQVRKRSVGRRPRIQAVPSKAQEPINVGLQIYVGFGAAKMAGLVWLW